MTSRFVRHAAVVAALLLAPAARAQTAAEHIAIGDRDHVAMHPVDAFHHYEMAAQADPKSYEAAWKAARDAVDAGELETDAARRTALYKSGELYARRAVAINPNDAEGHFHVARAVGRNALTMGSRDKVKYAAEVRAQALEALKLNPQHAGALHVMGVWNAEVMRLNGVSRFMAKNFLGGQVFGSANWKDAVRYMEQAVAIEPNNLTHRFDLAKIYEDVGNKAKARDTYHFIVNAPAVDAHDARYKQDADSALKRLG